MNYYWLKKWLAVGIILLFVGTCIVPSTAQEIERSSLSASRGTWLYVGGSGPGNYTKIQDAIDNASDGDTVYVFPGTYKERIEIQQSITLQGSDPLTTIIDSQSTENDIVTCVGTDIVITGFSIFNCSMNHSCVLINHTSDCMFIGNVIPTGGYGVTLRNAQNISIINNSFFQTLSMKSGYIGINIDNCIFSTISKNRISSWDCGIFIHGTHILITQNIVMNTHRGITDAMNALHPWTNKHLTIGNNFLNNNTQGIHLLGSTDYSIKHNEIKNSTSIGIYIAEDVYAGVQPENITIEENMITTSRYGIEVDYAINASIEGNQILQNTLGLLCKYNSLMSVKRNTFEGNNKTVTYRWGFFPFPSIQYKVPRFDRNFWNHNQTAPVPVFGRWSLFKPGMFFDHLDILPWVAFDWHPAQEPYDMPEMRWLK
jgi:nitrous oxidase accessory protein NosD